jgi:hypothetical protein
MNPRSKISIVWQSIMLKPKESLSLMTQVNVIVYKKLHYIVFSSSEDQIVEEYRPRLLVDDRSPSNSLQGNT